MSELIEKIATRVLAKLAMDTGTTGVAPTKKFTYELPFDNAAELNDMLRAGPIAGGLLGGLTTGALGGALVGAFSDPRASFLKRLLVNAPAGAAAGSLGGMLVGTKVMEWMTPQFDISGVAEDDAKMLQGGNRG